MFGFLLLAVVIVGIWLSLSLIGLLFKLIFGIVGATFGLIGGLFGLLFAGIVGILILPLLGLVMLPLLVPALLVGSLLWLLFRSPRRPVIVTQYR